MRALLFSEWATIRASLRQYLAVTAVMAFAIAAVSVTLSGTDATDAAAAASVVRTASIPSVSIMMTFFVFFALFGADERDGWEAVRLTLPVLRRQVVTARYIIMLCALVASTMLSAVAGSLAGSCYSWFAYGELIVPPLGEVAAICVALMSVFAAYVAIEMPIFFKWGLAKARPYFNVPSLVCLLLAIGPLRLAMDTFTSEAGMSSSSVLTQVGAEVGVGLGSALGNLWPLLAVLVIFCGLVYYISLRIAQRLYAGRNF